MMAIIKTTAATAATDAPIMTAISGPGSTVVLPLADVTVDVAMVVTAISAVPVSAWRVTAVRVSAVLVSAVRMSAVRGLLSVVRLPLLTAVVADVAVTVTVVVELTPVAVVAVLLASTAALVSGADTSVTLTPNAY